MPLRAASVLLLVLATCAVCALSPPTVVAAPPVAVKPGVVLVHPSSARGTKALARSPEVSGTVATLPGKVRLVAVRGDARAAAANLASVKGVGWAEPDYVLHASATKPSTPPVTPNDPLLPQQGDLGPIDALSGWAAAGLTAWPGGGGVAVGIVDTGIDAGHEDLSGRAAACGTATGGVVAGGRCADDEGHGTHVAGTIGAKTGNGVGMAGLAFASPLIVCKALGADGSGDTADIAACIRWVHTQGAKVISMSLGGPGSKTMAAAVEDAYARGGRTGSVIVAAAGNDGDGSTEYPAGLPQVVSVAATDDADAHAEFSNTNVDVEIAAPGVDVLSAKLGGGYVRESGTSMATPHVAAAAALLWGEQPSATASTIRGRLDASTDDLGAAGRDPVYGFGRLDLAKGLARRG